jgi:molybdate transport system ATP-binding protein
MAAEIIVDIAHRFTSGVDVRAALARTMRPGSIVALFGPSGAGKTTILRAIAGLLRPNHGRIAFDGRLWFDSAAKRYVPPQARRIGFVSQETALFPHLTVRNNIEYGLRGASATERQRRVAALLEVVHAAGLEDRFPKQLSGGQAQRVALARALAPSPGLLLLDEPFGALDLPTRRELRSEVRALLRETQTCAIVVTHDRLEALAMGDDLAVVVGGSLRQVGPVADVFQRPADAEVARSLGIETVLPAVVGDTDDGLVTLRVGAARLFAVTGATLRRATRSTRVCEPKTSPSSAARRHQAAPATGWRRKSCASSTKAPSIGCRSSVASLWSQRSPGSRARNSASRRDCGSPPRSRRPPFTSSEKCKAD